MIPNGDSTLRQYASDSLAYLSDIENDLIAMEAPATGMDEGRVIKAFRSAHTIRDGARFTGLVTVKTLAEELTRVLGMVRSGNIAASPALVGVILGAFERLRDILSDPANAARSPSSPARDRPRSSFKSAMTVVAPAACSRRTVASPRPEAPPLTRADLSRISMVCPPLVSYAQDNASWGRIQSRTSFSTGQP